MPWMHWTFVCLVWGWVLARACAVESLPVVGALPETIRQEFSLASHYQKGLVLQGLPLVGSSKVSDAAILEAAWIVRHVLAGREDLLKAMGANKTRLSVMAWNEFTTDIPEHAFLKPRVYWDRRARGLGATPQAPAVSCAEENLLGYPGDPYSTENICIHEFAHAIHEMGLSSLDRTFDKRLMEAYQNATNHGLWKGTYAASNRHEYWAEGVQSWFDDNRENDALHNHVNTRKELKVYDARLAQLCEEVFGDRPWRYQKPGLRELKDREHLASLDPASMPRFRWREEPVPDLTRVSVQTTLGDIELQLDARAAPGTVRNFLHYVNAGWYSDGAFFRTVTLANQPTNAVKIAVVQAQANPKRTNEFLAPIVLERTRDTGLRHLDGAVSMARMGPDTAQDHFFICIGDQPELDFGGKRNPDGQGFAVFGKVTRGMDVVRRIHALEAEGQLIRNPVRIQRAIRAE